LNHAGWEICGEASSNVLVKDWVMLGVNTLEVTRGIARRLPDTAIVLFSFHDLPEHGDTPKPQAFTAWLPKTLSSLIQAVEKALHSSANRQSASSDGITLSARPQPEGVR
jgi:DNA-binding NarL/FixJ family response regulator